MILLLYLELLFLLYRWSRKGTWGSLNDLRSDSDARQDDSEECRVGLVGTTTATFRASPGAAWCRVRRNDLAAMTSFSH